MPPFRHKKNIVPWYEHRTRYYYKLHRSKSPGSGYSCNHIKLHLLCSYHNTIIINLHKKIVNPCRYFL
nr:MAG TPA: hypothetical protein [Inoviridae sp.]